MFTPGPEPKRRKIAEDKHAATPVPLPLHPLPPLGSLGPSRSLSSVADGLTRITLNPEPSKRASRKCVMPSKHIFIDSSSDSSSSADSSDLSFSPRRRGTTSTSTPRSAPSESPFEFHRVERSRSSSVEICEVQKGVGSDSRRTKTTKAARKSVVTRAVWTKMVLRKLDKSELSDAVPRPLLRNPSSTSLDRQIIICSSTPPVSPTSSHAIIPNTRSLRPTTSSQSKPSPTAIPSIPLPPAVPEVLENADARQCVAFTRSVGGEEDGEGMMVVDEPKRFTAAEKGKGRVARVNLPVVDENGCSLDGLVADSQGTQLNTSGIEPGTRTGDSPFVSTNANDFHPPPPRLKSTSPVRTSSRRTVSKASTSTSTSPRSRNSSLPGTLGGLVFASKKSTATVAAAAMQAHLEISSGDEDVVVSVVDVEKWLDSSSDVEVLSKSKPSNNPSPSHVLMPARPRTINEIRSGLRPPAPILFDCTPMDLCDSSAEEEEEDDDDLTFIPFWSPKRKKVVTRTKTGTASSGMKEVIVISSAEENPVIVENRLSPSSISCVVKPTPTPRASSSSTTRENTSPMLTRRRLEPIVPLPVNPTLSHFVDHSLPEDMIPPRHFDRLPKLEIMPVLSTELELDKKDDEIILDDAPILPASPPRQVVDILVDEFPNKQEEELRRVKQEVPDVAKYSDRFRKKVEQQEMNMLARSLRLSCMVKEKFPEPSSECRVRVSYDDEVVPRYVTVDLAMPREVRMRPRRSKVAVPKFTSSKRVAVHFGTREVYREGEDFCFSDEDNPSTTRAADITRDKFIDSTSESDKMKVIHKLWHRFIAYNPYSFHRQANTLFVTHIAPILHSLDARPELCSFLLNSPLSNLEARLFLKLYDEQVA